MSEAQANTNRLESATRPWVVFATSCHRPSSAAPTRLVQFAIAAARHCKACAFPIYLAFSPAPAPFGPARFRIIPMFAAPGLPGSSKFFGRGWSGPLKEILRSSPFNS
jgi:hypothetical protein